MKQAALVLLFLTLNFGGLYLGNLLMNNGPQSQWYLKLNKAPWTPPGWVFGVSWTLIMICFSIYLSNLFSLNLSTKVVTLFVVQFILNVSWNYIFFNQHQPLLALVVIIALTLLIWYFFFNYLPITKHYSYLLLPYMIWLSLATSLNLYVVLYN